MAKTLYQLLGVPSTATHDAIKDAYVKQAARLRTAGATGEAEVLKQAYDVLSDARLRARYDREAYTVGGEMTAAAAPEEAERHWLLTPRGALITLGVVAILVFGWSYHKREQQRVRLVNERIEAARFAEEQRLAQERRDREIEARRAEERRREATEAAAAQYGSRSARNETMYRESVDYQRSMRERQLEMQRERDAARREDLERRRIDLQNQRDLARDKRQAQELERTSPRRF